MAIPIIIIYLIIGIVSLFALQWGMSTVTDLIQIIINGAPQLIGLSMAIVGIYYLITHKDKYGGGLLLFIGACIAIFSQFVMLIQIIFQNWIVLIIGMAMVFVYVLKKEGVLE